MYIVHERKVYKREKRMKIKKLTFLALLIALCFVGSYIKIPATTIGFDSMPGYFGGLLFGMVSGGVVGALGHLITAAISGFPLTLPTHIIIAITMFIAVAGTAWCAKKFNYIVAIIAGTILNGVLSPLMLIPLKLLPVVALKGTIIFLLPISFANVLLAVIIYKAVVNMDVISNLNPYVKK